jgi:hypothetical protein
MGRCLQTIRPIWSSDALSAHELRAFAKASELAGVLEPLPNLEASWQATCCAPSHSLAKLQNGDVRDERALQEWNDLVGFVVRCEPLFFRRPSTKMTLALEVSALIALATQLLAARGNAAVFGALHSALETAAAIAEKPEIANSLRELATQAIDAFVTLDGVANRIEARNRSMKMIQGRRGGRGGSASQR